MNEVGRGVTPISGPSGIESSGLQAWRVLYRPIDRAVHRMSGQVYRLTEPEPTVAFVESIEPAQALEQPRAASEDGPLALIWLPSSLASGLFEQEVETWLGKPGELEIVRASIRTVRVVWTLDRCVIFSPSEQFTDAKDAVLRFTLAKRQTVSLERRMLDVWSDLRRDLPLSHPVPFWRHMLRRRINYRTERIAGMNAEHLRLKAALEQFDIKLSSASKRLYAELVLQATIHDRLEAMEGPIEFAMAHYELANTRIIETRNAWRDHWLEAGIMILLAVQVILQVAGR